MNVMVAWSGLLLSVNESRKIIIVSYGVNFYLVLTNAFVIITIDDGRIAIVVIC